MVLTTLSMSISSLGSYLPKLSSPSRATRGRVCTQPRTLAILSDPHVLRLAETLEDSISSTSSTSQTPPPPPPPLQKLRDISSDSLLSTAWPSRKDEAFRFTDTSFIKNYDVQPVQPSSLQSLDYLNVLGDTLLPNLAIVDGYLVDSLSHFSELPDGVFVGALSSVNSQMIMSRVSKYASSFQGDLFWSLNGMGAPDIIFVYVPEGCKVESTSHLRFLSLKGDKSDSKLLPISNPRVLVLVENGGEIGIVEEYMGADGDTKCYWTNSVVEVVIGDGGKVTHSYIQRQSMEAVHVKWTSVRQESTSVYELTEVSIGRKLSRHNVHVQRSARILQQGYQHFICPLAISYKICIVNWCWTIHVVFLGNYTSVLLHIH